MQPIPDQPQIDWSAFNRVSVRRRVKPKTKPRPYDELWGADDNCDHNIVSANGGGVKCTKCAGWCCY